MAQALAAVAQRRMVATHDDEATAPWATRALELAERLEGEPLAIHALATLAIVEIDRGLPDGWCPAPRLRMAHRLRDRARAR